MIERYVSRKRFPELVTTLISQYQVLGPVARGACHEFGQITAADQLDLRVANTRLSPKGLFMPQSERMFHFSLDPGDERANIVEEVPKDFSERVVLGIRPCDARALELVDANFITDRYRDPWWVRRRQTTVLFGLACREPAATCFCAAVGGGPYGEVGLDVLMAEVDGGYYLKSCSDKGADLLGRVDAGEAVSESVRGKFERAREESLDKMERPFDAVALRGIDVKDLFSAPFWEEVQFACVNCGTCTYLCPTCWCFDIQDEAYKNRGLRLRNWDSCMFPLFTLHGSGHNPRQQKLQRVRQRFMHKFKYYMDKYDSGPACVGCGRCVQLCPVNIDIRRVVSMMTAC